MLARFEGSSKTANSTLPHGIVVRIKVQHPKYDESRLYIEQKPHEFTFEIPSMHGASQKKLLNSKCIDGKLTANVPTSLMSQANNGLSTLAEFLTFHLTPFVTLPAELLIFDTRVKPFVPDINRYLLTAWSGLIIWKESLHNFDISSQYDSMAKSVILEFACPRIEWRTGSLKEVTLVFRARVREDPARASSKDRKYDWKLTCPYILSFTSTVEHLSIHLTFQSDRACDLSVENNADITTEKKRLLLEFLTTQYLKLVEESGILTATFKTENHAARGFSSPLRDYPGGIWNMEHSQLSNWDDVTNARANSAQGLLAISEESINAQLAEYHQSHASRFQAWNYGYHFQATFARPRVELQSDQRAILWIHIEDASFVPVEPGDVGLPSKSGKQGKKISLKEHHCLAFEVKLVLRSADPPAPGTGYKLCFDTKEARFSTEHSWPTKCPDELYSVLVYIQKDYLPSLANESFLVIDCASFATSQGGTSTGDRSPTLPRLLVHSNGVDTAIDKMAQLSSQAPPIRPVLLIYQPSGDAHASPAFESSSWVARPTARNAFSHGTLAVSQHVFVHNILLARLKPLNATTTFFVVTSGILTPFPRGLQGPTLVPSAGLLTTPPEYAFEHITSTEPLTDCYEYTTVSECVYDGPRFHDKGVMLVCNELSSCCTKNRLTITKNAGAGLYSIVIEGAVTWIVSRTGDQADSDPSIQSGSAEISLTWKWEVLKRDGTKMQTNSVDHIKKSIKVTSTLLSGQVGAWADLESRKKSLHRVFLKNISSFKLDLLEELPRLLPSQPHYTLGKAIFNNAGEVLVELCHGGTDSADKDRGTAPTTSFAATNHKDVDASLRPLLTSHLTPMHA
ncbi:hypothetical protein PYCCODRAFT_1471118 [Trametes coccinea BRFM310]|uniref:Uncharacterized protein n=1 Tax=Trametes coccinea (strain BRFM310) TaxID=1353009 RepID=A0A1Y2IEJ9_TRAC3|nr:hypothetical protein PYCCODRAFT_1471118 [Trametes coccinea BRFM310]